MSDVLAAIVMVIACIAVVVMIVWIRHEAGAQRERFASESNLLKQRSDAELAQLRKESSEIERRSEQLAEREGELAADVRKSAEFTRDLERRADAVRAAESALATAQAAMAEVETAALARIAGLEPEEARTELIARLEEEARGRAAGSIRRIEEEGRREAERRARDILATAVQRLAAETSSENAITLVMLPSEDFKGRIIGREGRNIRTFEALTGVNLVVDDSPDSVLLSGFDPARREIAKLTLEALLADGRIHPQRIESAYEAALEQVKGLSLTVGDEAAEQAGVVGLPPELLRVLGDLRLRTSYGQNVLSHLIESAQIAAMLAAEMGLDVELARRAAFLHDIGKALTQDHEGPHAVVGAELIERYGESPLVVNAVAAHHDDVPAQSIEAIVVQAADASSAARPGARREDPERYVDRMRRLEAIARANPGVLRVYAMSAGREIRVAVEPSLVDDRATQRLADEIAATIQREVQYPGQIKVVVVRELRAGATAS